MAAINASADGVPEDVQRPLDGHGHTPAFQRRVPRPPSCGQTGRAMSKTGPACCGATRSLNGSPPCLECTAFGVRQAVVSHLWQTLALT